MNDNHCEGCERVCGPEDIAISYDVGFGRITYCRDCQVIFAPDIEATMLSVLLPPQEMPHRYRMGVGWHLFLSTLAFGYDSRAIRDRVCRTRYPIWKMVWLMRLAGLVNSAFIIGAAWLFFYLYGVL